YGRTRRRAGAARRACSLVAQRSRTERRAVVSGVGNGGAFTSARRKQLFVEMARRAEGIAPPDVHQRALTQGDTVTEETYYNIARVLHQRGLVRKDDSTRPARYFANSAVEEKWLDEEDLLNMLDPDYPLLALTIANETARQVHDVSEEIW